MINEVAIEKKMEEAYLNYSLSVIIGRALPDVRDGLKPVHRRILYGARDLGLTPEKPHKKSARIVGEVLGKYHPHGDAAVYEAMVRMAQDFSQRYLLIDGHGNFGSIDGDSPAAMRYTEARLAPIAQEMLQDIQEETVDFMETFDGSLQEPSVLPSRIPNLLVNGSSGIAVGMSTSIPPHNLGEVIDGTIYLLENPEGNLEDLLEIIQGPDFPTHGIILGKEGIIEAYRTGKGKITIRAKAEVEKDKGKEQIIIKEIPYQVNKSRLLEEMAEMVKKNRIEHVAAIRDESDREGIRIVVELKNRARTRIVLNNLFQYTSLQVSYRLNFLTLVEKQPVVLNLKELLTHFIQFRKEVVTRRSSYRLKKLEEKLHLLEGIQIALDKIDLIISIIRKAPQRSIAKERLMEALRVSDIQAQEILRMRLERLVATEREELLLEMDSIKKEIRYLSDLLEKESLLVKEIKKELMKVKKDFADKRRTSILLQEEEASLKEKDLIEKEDLYLSLSYRFYLKRSREEERLRAGKKDFMTHIFQGTTMDTLLFFTADGQVYLLMAYQIQESHGLSMGDPLSRLIKFDQKKIVGVLLAPEKSKKLVTIATRNGLLKKTPLLEYMSTYTTIKAINLEEGDEVIDVALTDGNQEIFLATVGGKSIYFSEEEVGITGRITQGSRGIKRLAEDYVMNMNIVTKDDEILVIDKEGRARRTPMTAFQKQRRYGKGLQLVRKGYQPFKVLTTNPKRSLLFVTGDGNFIALPVSNIPLGDRTNHLYQLKELKGSTLKDVILLPPSMEIEDYLTP